MDNAPLRLYRLLQAMKDYPHEQKSVASVWKAVLSIEDDMDMPQKVGAVLLLSGQAARQILDVEPDALGAVQHWRHQIYQFCSYGFGSKWAEARGQIDKHTLEYLKLHARIVEHVSPSTDVPIDRLNEARTALETAIDEIRASDLRADIKFLLIDRIQSIVVAIGNYLITGQEGVFNAFKVAGIDLREPLSAADIPGKQSLRVGLSIIADLMTVAASGAALAGPVSNLLELLQ